MWLRSGGDNPYDGEWFNGSWYSAGSGNSPFHSGTIICQGAYIGFRATDDYGCTSSTAQWDCGGFGP